MGMAPIIDSLIDLDGSRLTPYGCSCPSKLPILWGRLRPNSMGSVRAVLAGALLPCEPLLKRRLLHDLAGVDAPQLNLVARMVRVTVPSGSKIERGLGHWTLHASVRYLHSN